MDHADVEVVGGVAVAFCNELFGGGEGVGGMHASAHSELFGGGDGVGGT